MVATAAGGDDRTVSVADQPMTIGTHTRDGVDFVDDGTDASRRVLADSAAPVDRELAQRIRDTRRWRRQYVELLVDLTREAARSRRASMAIAQAGLRSISEAVIFARDGQTTNLSEALANVPPDAEIATRVIEVRSVPLPELEVPYHGGLLRQASLLAQLERWVDNGIVEPSFAVAITRVVAHPEWLSLPGRQVAVAGACSDLSPVLPLLAWGAHVLAVDDPGQRGWTHIAEAARRSPGQLRAPMSRRGGLGLSVTRQLPELRDWIERNASDRLVLGSYGSGNGIEHMRLSAAVDALAANVLETVPGASLAYLATANDAFAVDGSVASFARDAYDRNPLSAFGRHLPPGRWRVKSYSSQTPGRANVANGLLRRHGPHYAVAKRVERWRGLTSVGAGHTVSFNVAPPVLTRPVRQRGRLGAAARGARALGVEAFAADTARVLMAALLVHDLHQPAPAPAMNPEALFTEQAAHGGIWRSGFELRSVMSLAAAVTRPT